MNNSRGFTLIELMIAILIFTMISTAAYKMFNSVSRAQQVTDGILDHLDGMQRALVVIEKDLFQIAPRPIRDEFGDKQRAILAPGQNGELLEFTRFGWRNPLKEVRSDLQRVAYNLEDGELIRYYWLMLDRAPDPVVVRQVLMTEVVGVRLKFMDEKKRWQTTWPPKNQEQPQLAQAVGKVGKGEGLEDRPQMPHAIELTVHHKGYGALTTILPLMTYKPSEVRRLWPEQEKSEVDKKKQPPLEEDEVDLENVDYEEE